MTKITWIAACLAPVAGLQTTGQTPHNVEIKNDVLRARVHLPDPKAGFYRGTRFDWAGVIEDLEFAGHNYYPQWFQRTDPNVHDFIYDGADIVASPCTAITGPCEEFSTNGKALGFDEAKPGGTFIKIGVGVLRRPDDRPYDAYRLYEIADGGHWTVRGNPDAVEFTQELLDASTGYGYAYEKKVSIMPGKPRLVLEHRLRNTGKRPIQSTVYNHNFLFLDRLAPGPDFTITVPFDIRLLQPPDNSLAVVRGRQIGFSKALAGQERVYLVITGFAREAKDYDIRVESRQAGAGVRITGDRPLAKLSMWSIRASLSVEPFVEISIEPGAEFQWRIAYDYYEVRKTQP